MKDILKEKLDCDILLLIDIIQLVELAELSWDMSQFSNIEAMRFWKIGFGGDENDTVSIT